MCVDRTGSLEFFSGRLANYLSGHAHDDGPGRDTTLLCDHGARGNQALLPNLATGKQHRTNPYQRIPADVPAVNHGAMPEDHTFLDFDVQARIRVDHATVLNIDARPERDAR
jgi:hypothetical protein